MDVASIVISFDQNPSLSTPRHHLTTIRFVSTANDPSCADMTHIAAETREHKKRRPKSFGDGREARVSGQGAQVRCIISTGPAPCDCVIITRRFLSLLPLKSGARLCWWWV